MTILFAVAIVFTLIGIYKFAQAGWVWLKWYGWRQ